MLPSEQEKYERVRKRVNELKGFYVHATVYVIVNAFILVNIYIHTMGDNESFWQAGHFFTLIFWGLGLAFHAIHTFDLNPFFGKKWEARQIKKFMEKDQEESRKYE